MAQNPTKTQFVCVKTHAYTRITQSKMCVYIRITPKTKNMCVCHENIIHTQESHKKRCESCARIIFNDFPMAPTPNGPWA